MTVGAVLVALALASPWKPVGPGVWQREIRMAEKGPLAVVRVHAVRIDPALAHFVLDSATRSNGTSGAWTVERIPRDALVAVNTGQFIGGVVWGWVVHNGMETSPPGTGTLAMSFVVDSAGIPSMLTPAELPRARGRVRLAFQSYPMLLTGEGELPSELQAAGRGIDLEHRDSRLAIGLMPDGSVIIALTRFNALGTAAETLPWGPTVVEMAEFMRELGCRRAMMLDGGISSQMALRLENGAVRTWSNWRQVPLGLVVRSR
jgi:exopolysaccharide biosynthesis protein